MNQVSQLSRLFLLLVMCSILLVGCLPKKGKTKKVRLRKKPVNYLLKKMNENEFSPSTFSGKAKIKFNQDDFTLRGDATIRVEKDKRIWISVAPKIGVQIEAARALITPDSIKVLDKFNRVYYAEKFEYIQRFINYPLSFHDLQTLILGGSLEKSSFTDTHINFGYHQISSEDCLLYLHPNSYEIYQMYLNDIENNQKLTAVYNDYKNIGDSEQYRFSNQRDYDLEANNQAFEIDLQFAKVKVDETVDMPFKVKKSYKKGKL